MEAESNKAENEKTGSGHLQHLVMHDGYLPAFDGTPILASCEHCTDCSDVSDGPEYGPAWYVCDKKPHMSNLKGFPFKTAQKCCILSIGFTADWDTIAKEDGLT